LPYVGREDKVKKGDVLLEIYAEQESKLAEAYNVALRTKPVTVEGMLLYRIPEQFRKVVYNQN